MTKKKEAKIIANIAWLGKPNGTISPERCQTLLFGHNWLEKVLPASFPDVSNVVYVLVGEYSSRVTGGIHTTGGVHFQGKLMAISACLTLQEELTITAHIDENGHNQQILQAKVLDWKLLLQKRYVA